MNRKQQTLLKRILLAVAGYAAVLIFDKSGAAESLRKDGSMYVEMQAISASTAEIGFNKVGCEWI